MTESKQMREPRPQPPSHPFRRYVATTEANERDEFHVVQPSSIIGHRGVGRRNGGNGGGR